MRERDSHLRVHSAHERRRRWAKRRERVLKTVAVLPSLATLGNLVCGLGAIYMCMLSVGAGGADLERATLGNSKIEHFFPTFLAIGAYLIVGAMAFDGIDGRLARFARKTSEFGAQLDSLADMVSFGIAPAVLVLCIAHPGDVTSLGGLERVYWRTEWVMAAVFSCCAALRLARFNVENVSDESAHMGFRGLPTPGAAGAVVGLVLFHQELLRDLASTQALHFVALLMPPFALVLGLFMVSRFRYLHMVNSLLRRRRSFRQVVGLVIFLLVGLIIQPQLTIAVVTAAYAMSGPVLHALTKLRGQAPVESAAQGGTFQGVITSPPAEDDHPFRSAS